MTDQKSKRNQLSGHANDLPVDWNECSGGKTQKSMKKQKLQLAILVVAMGMAAQLQAAWYDLSFTGGSSVASGQIDVVDGLAVNGYLDVTAGANIGTYDLLLGGPSEQTFVTSDGTDLNYDNKVTLGSNPFLDVYGLAFADGPANTAGVVGFNLFGNGPNSYSLFGDPPWGAPYVNADATLVAVPEPVSTTKVAGISALGVLLVTLRKKISMVK